MFTESKFDLMIISGFWDILRVQEVPLLGDKVNGHVYDRFSILKLSVTP